MNNANCTWQGLMSMWLLTVGGNCRGLGYNPLNTWHNGTEVQNIGNVTPQFKGAESDQITHC